MTTIAVDLSHKSNTRISLSPQLSSAPGFSVKAASEGCLHLPV